MAAEAVIGASLQEHHEAFPGAVHAGTLHGAGDVAAVGGTRVVGRTEPLPGQESRHPPRAPLVGHDAQCRPRTQGVPHRDHLTWGAGPRRQRGIRPHRHHLGRTADGLLGAAFGQCREPRRQVQPGPVAAEPAMRHGDAPDHLAHPCPYLCGDPGVGYVVTGQPLHRLGEAGDGEHRAEQLRIDQSFLGGPAEPEGGGVGRGPGGAGREHAGEQAELLRQRRPEVPVEAPAVHQDAAHQVEADQSEGAPADRQAYPRVDEGVVVPDAGGACPVVGQQRAARVGEGGGQQRIGVRSRVDPNHEARPARPDGAGGDQVEQGPGQGPRPWPDGGVAGAGQLPELGPERGQPGVGPRFGAGGVRGQQGVQAAQGEGRARPLRQRAVGGQQRAEGRAEFRRRAGPQVAAPPGEQRRVVRQQVAGPGAGDCPRGGGARGGEVRAVQLVQLIRFRGVRGAGDLMSGHGVPPPV